MPQPTTIETYLPDGKPTGVKIIQNRIWTVKMVVIPRSELKHTLIERAELATQCVYLLVGEESSGLPKVYVGETENFTKRIEYHHRHKDFWITAICFLAKDGNLTKAHVKYLEAQLYEELKAAGRVEVESGNAPSKPALSESETAYVDAFAEHIRFLLSSVNYTFMKKAKEGEELALHYSFAGQGFHAEGFPSSEGFVVLAGAHARKHEAESFKGTAGSVTRAELISRGVLVDKDDSYELISDYTFSSPSKAAAVFAGRAESGWIRWKTANGKTLSDVERE